MAWLYVLWSFQTLIARRYMETRLSVHPITRTTIGKGFINMEISEKLIKRLQSIAEQEQRSVEDLLETLLEAHISRRKMPANIENKAVSIVPGQVTSPDVESQTRSDEAP